MKLLKPILSIILACTLLCGCQTKESHVTSYDDGYTDGYLEGMKHAQKEIASLVEEYYSDIYYPDLEDYMNRLWIYSDGIYEDEFEEPILEAYLQEAVGKLLEAQRETEKIIYDIDEMEIY